MGILDSPKPQAPDPQADYRPTQTPTLNARRSAIKTQHKKRRSPSARGKDKGARQGARPNNHSWSLGRPQCFKPLPGL